MSGATGWSCGRARVSAASKLHTTLKAAECSSADAGPQEVPDEEARGDGTHVHPARVVRDNEHREEHEFGAVQREKTSAGEQLYSNPYAARVEVEEAEFTHLSSASSSSRNERSSAFILQVYFAN